jgi:hypothetical protein
MTLAAKLEAQGFSATAAKNPRFLFCYRGEVACLIDTASGQSGAAMVATPRGMATLLWRDGQAYLSAAGGEELATAQQLAEVQSFQRDLQAAVNA